MKSPVNSYRQFRGINISLEARAKCQQGISRSSSVRVMLSRALRCWMDMGFWEDGDDKAYWRGVSASNMFRTSCYRSRNCNKGTAREQFRRGSNSSRYILFTPLKSDPSNKVQELWPRFDWSWRQRIRHILRWLRSNRYCHAYLAYSDIRT